MAQQTSLVIRPQPRLVGEDRGFTWADISRFLKNYVWVILGVFLLTVLSAYAALSFVTEQYDVEASLLVKLGRENLDPPAVSRNVPLSVGVRPEEIQSEIEILKSPVILGQIVDELGEDAFADHTKVPEALFPRIKYEVKMAARQVKKMYKDTLISLDLKKRLDWKSSVLSDIEGNLSVEPRKDSDVITIRLRGPNPELSKEFVNRLIEHYLERRITVRQNAGVDAFLAERERQRYQDLMATRAQEMEWKKKTGLVATDAQKNELLTRLSQLSSQYAATERSIESLKQQQKETQDRLAAAPDFFKTSEDQQANPVYLSLKEKITQLQTERARLLSKYLETSEPVRNAEREIALLNKELATVSPTVIGQVKTERNPLLATLRTKLEETSIQLAGLQKEEGLQKTQIESLNAELQKADTDSGHLLDIERQRKLAEDDYVAVARRRLDADVTKQLDQQRISNVSPISIPVAGSEPVYPRKLLIMGVALIVGLVFGVGISMLLEYMDDTVRSASQAEKLTGLLCLQEFQPEDLPAVEP